MLFLLVFLGAALMKRIDVLEKRIRALEGGG